jgi:flotillin
MSAIEAFVANLWWIAIILGVVIAALVTTTIYTMVPANEAHVAIRHGKKRVYSSDPKYSKDSKAAYFHIPRWVPGLGMLVHRMPLKILSIAVPEFLTFDMYRARFTCEIRAYVMIEDPIVAATRFPTEGRVGIDLEELGAQISKIVEATMRDSTTKKNIRDIINNREDIISYIRKPLTEVISSWGLTLTDIELIDFKDPTAVPGEKDPPHVIRDISTMIEVEINSEMRRKNAEQTKTARLTEAETEQIAKNREIEKDEQIAKREQQKNQIVAEQRKFALVKELEVTKTQQVTMQSIEKEKMIVEANQRKEIEAINREQKKLVGEGDRLMKEEQAKGDAAPIRERGFAEAAAKEKLQASLNKFSDAAIRAMVAEQVVAMQQAIGVAGAKAFENSDMRVFVGSDNGGGFDVGKMIEGIRTSSTGAATATMNQLARPRDLGFEEIVGAFADQKTKPRPRKKAPEPEKKEDLPSSPPLSQKEVQKETITHEETVIPQIQTIIQGTIADLEKELTPAEEQRQVRLKRARRTM